MFTGIISDVARILEMSSHGEINRLIVETSYDPDDINLGASIASNGVCLTVVDVDSENLRAQVSFDVGAETLAVTTLRDWTVGQRINLERALRVGDELGGHMVSGHVDGVARIISRRDFDGMAHFRFHAPHDLSRYLAVKGSVALDGASLTVNAVAGDEFEVLLSPHTLAVTAWNDRKPGDQVNIEVDQMARYAARLIEFR